MKIKDILDGKHTVYGNANNGIIQHDSVLTDRLETSLSLCNIIFKLGAKYKDKVNELRSLTYKSDEYNKLKKQFPCWMVGGEFEYGKSYDSAIKTYSNIISIDIDKCDNDFDLMAIRNKLFELPYVIGVFKSISGLGLYVLVLVEDGHYTKEYYSYIANLWNNKYGLNIDTQCTNIGRKRFISYDDDIYNWIKDEDVDIIPWTLKTPNIPKAEYSILPNRTSVNGEEDMKTSMTHKAMWLVINKSKYYVNGYTAWYHLGCELANFHDGHDMFLQVNTNYGLDSVSVAEKKWKQCKPSGITEDLHRKWQGMAKNRFGAKWWNLLLG